MRAYNARVRGPAARAIHSAIRGSVSARRVCATLTLAACAGALQAPAALARGQIWEWKPNGPEAGPQVVLEHKPSPWVSGRFGVQCGKHWLYSIFGLAFKIDAVPGTISGTVGFATNSVGLGSSYRGAEIDFFDFKSAGPVTVTINAQETPASAVGTLALKLYSYTKPRRHDGHTIKAKKVLSASCSIPFDAVDEAPGPPEPAGEPRPSAPGPEGISEEAP